MRYQVTYRKRFDQQGDGSDSPEVLLNLPDGVVSEATRVSQNEPDSTHVEEGMEEDDDFLPFGSEVWEYEVSDSRADEFVNALTESGVVLEYDLIESDSDDELDKV